MTTEPVVTAFILLPLEMCATDLRPGDVFVFSFLALDPVLVATLPHVQGCSCST